MAVPTVDDRVFCYACKCVTTSFDHFKLTAALKELPKPVFEMVMALIGLNTEDEDELHPTYRVVAAGQKGLFSQPMTDNDCTRAAGAVAQGNADVLLDEADRTTVKFTHGPHAFHTLSLSYLPRDLAAAEQLKGSDTVHPALLEKLPPLEKRAATELAKLGFAVRHHDVESSMRRIFMFKGSAREGIRAEICWIP